ncbi:MAG: iron-sulfur protein [Treponema sp.]|nr:iron-sulfur protein [Treponema sp.]
MWRHEEQRRDLKAALTALALEAGFVRARILAPFKAPADAHRGVPESYKAGAPSLLMAALAYGNLHETLPAPADQALARIAPFARRNYYREGVKGLQKLGAALRARHGGRKSDFRILCNSPVPEKPLAQQAGLGVLGRNGLLITPEAGSLVILAAMTLPFPLEPDEAEADLRAGNPFPRCKHCDPVCPPCVAACPTGALPGDGSLDPSRCIQWYASGHGAEVPPEIARHWGKRLYGCTDCQDACVYNRMPIPGVPSDEGPLPAYMDPLEIGALSDEALQARFKGSALGLSWLGPGGIRRNARLAAQGRYGLEGTGNR